MTESRKKPGVAFWATVVVVVLLIGYPLSIGPATWIEDRFWTRTSHRTLGAAYRPVLWIAVRCPESVQALLCVYLSAGLAGEEQAAFTDESIVRYTE